MSLIQIFSLALLVLAFAVAIARHINVGLTTIPAGFLLCVVAGVPVDTYYAQFPGSLVLLILGVTLLFTHAHRSGAIDRLTDLAVGATGRRDWVLPWIMFLLAAVLSGIGALPAAALAIVVPIAMGTAHRRGINLTLMGLVTISGALAGGFSPLSVWGQLIVTLTDKAHRPISHLGMFVIEFLLQVVVALVAFLVFGGIALMRRPPGAAPGEEREAGQELAQAPGEPETWPSGAAPGTSSGSGKAVAVRPAAARRTTAPGTATAPQATAPAGTATSTAAPAAPAPAGVTPYQVTSLLGIAAFVAIVLVFDADVGLTAFSVALVLQVLHRPAEKEMLRGLPWSVVLVITGVLLYVGVLQQVGTLDAIEKHLGGIESLGLSILVLGFVGSLFASFESSSVAVLGLVIPVAIKITSGVSSTALLLILSAVSWAIVVSSPSPYHVSGGLVLASSPDAEQQGLFRRLLLWAVCVAATVPLFGWLLPTLGPS
ncbi:SLC13 family permease [Streptomyces sp. NPDC050560]|uniref:SLC13 family permease n=1 Tax=Streptomyces sp. NPDC050560 TaxID=3365630 RepID=UPI003788DBCE